MDLEKIRERIEEKRRSFEAYKFDAVENDLLKTFFDLAQEYETLDNFYRLSVAVIKEFFDLDSRLYLVSREGVLSLVCDTIKGIHPDQPPAPEGICLNNHSYSIGGSWVGPIQGNMILVDQPAVLRQGAAHRHAGGLPPGEDHRAHALLPGEIHQPPGLQPPQQDHRLAEYPAHPLHQQPGGGHRTQRHHPQHQPEPLFKEAQGQDQGAQGHWNAICFKADSPEAAQLHDLVEEMEQDYQTLERQYRGVSLFIESLFRPSHFQKGQLVLRRRTARVLSDIITPQLQLFLPKLKERDIDIDVGLGGVPDVDFPLSVDKGLMAQVYANLFSNAVKYTRTNHEGRKYLSFGREELKDYFGPGKDGIKFNVFSTGPHIPPGDVPRIFDEGYRGSNIDKEVGTGRGLYFMRNVIETHGGVVGYEPTYEGNNFYFVLPLVTGPEPPLSVEVADESNHH